MTRPSMESFDSVRCTEHVSVAADLKEAVESEEFIVRKCYSSSRRTDANGVSHLQQQTLSTSTDESDHFLCRPPGKAAPVFFAGPPLMRQINGPVFPNKAFPSSPKLFALFLPHLRGVATHMGSPASKAGRCSLPDIGLNARLGPKAARRRAFVRIKVSSAPILNGPVQRPEDARSREHSPGGEYRGKVCVLGAFPRYCTPWHPRIWSPRDIMTCLWPAVR